jgi:hypothetical protein
VLKKLLQDSQIGASLLKDDGEVLYVDANRVVVNYKERGEKEYKITNFYRTNDNTSFFRRLLCR